MLKLGRSLAVLLLVMAISLSAGLHGAAADQERVLAERQKLENGLTVLVKNRPSGGQAIVQLWVRTGSYNETAPQAGLSHFLEHMVINRGSRNWAAGDLPKAVDRIGGEQNGGTSFDYTHYYIQAGSDQLDLMLRMLADVGFEATFAPDQISEEEPVIEEEIRRAKDSPGNSVFYRAMELALAGTPYERPVLGSVDTVKRIDHDAFMQYYKRHYVPGNMVLVVAGDVTSAQVMPLVHAIFDKYPAAQIPAPVPSSFTLPNKPVVVIEENPDLDEGDARALMVQPVPVLKPDEQALFDLLCEAFGGSRYSVFAKAMARSDVIDSISCYNYQFKQAELFVISASGGSKKVKSFERTLSASLKRVFSQVDKFDFEKARQRLMTQLSFDCETLADLADTIGSAECFGAMEDNAAYLEAVVKAKPSDVKAFAAKYLNPKAYTLVIQHNPEKK